MTELEHLTESTIIRNDSLKCRVIEWPVKRTAAEPLNYCAYNRTREKFLCARVELADLQPQSLHERIATLTPGSESALWLAPFRGISPHRVTTPIDLVYLDRNNCVLAAVESFPVSRATSSNWPAGTVLAMPARTIAASGTRAGDQLILCSPQKMKVRLQCLHANPAGVCETTIKMTSWEEIRVERRPHAYAFGLRQLHQPANSPTC